MGGIQSFSALTEDPSFNQINNEYDVDSHNRLCKNLDVYIYISNYGLSESVKLT